MYRHPNVMGQDIKGMNQCIYHQIVFDQDYWMISTMASKEKPASKPSSSSISDKLNKYVAKPEVAGLSLR